jgi:predicted ArsR family transcriptional regulator
MTMPQASISTAALRVIKLLVGSPPQSIAALIDASGVTRTAVTEQLNELFDAGLVVRTRERLPGRGRPRHLYSATPAALLLFAGQQHLLVPAVWTAIHEVGGDALAARIVDCASRFLAEHYSARLTATDPKERFRQLGALLAEEGWLVETESQNGQVLLRKRTCPFIAMLNERRAVCDIDREMMSRVVGRPVRRLAWRHEGAPCCVVTIDDEV